MHKTIIPFLFILFTCIFISCGTQTDEKKAGVVSDSLSVESKLSAINELIKSNPNNPDNYYKRAGLHFQNKDLTTARSDIERAIGIDSANTDYYLLLADIQFNKQEVKATKETLEKCLKVNPEKTEAYLKLGELYMLLEQYDKAIENINAALKTDIHNAKAYFMKGMVYKFVGDTAKAVSSIQTATEQNNDYYEAYIQLGLLYAKINDPLAIGYYNNALRIKPESKEAKYNLAIFYQENNEPLKAIEIYEQMLEKNPAAPNLHFNIGYVKLVYMKKYEEAIPHFSKAIQLHPGYFEAYTNRGVCYEQLNNPKAAEENFRQALSIKPDYELAAKALSRIID
jgi:tetratricopeptide (TPR) repeat protein